MLSMRIRSPQGLSISGMIFCVFSLIHFHVVPFSRDTAREYCQEKLQPRVLEAYRHEGNYFEEFSHVL
jgi:hypothetical protein